MIVNANAGTVAANVTGTLTGDTKASDAPTIIGRTAKTITGTQLVHTKVLLMQMTTLRIDGV